MSRYVTLPEYNMPKAIAMIDTVGPTLTGIAIPTPETFVSRRWGYSPFSEHLKLVRSRIVDAFMAKYPRGKGTKDDTALREFYAACYHWKRAQSAKRYSRLADDRQRNAFAAAQALPKTLMNMFLALPEDGSSVTNPTGSTKHWLTLWKAGLTTGFFHPGDRGRAAEMWLTDAGMPVRKAWIERREREEKEKEIRKATSRLMEIEALLDHIAVHAPRCALMSDNFEFVDFIGHEAKRLIDCRPKAKAK